MCCESQPELYHHLWPSFGLHDEKHGHFHACSPPGVLMIDSAIWHALDAMPELSRLTPWTSASSCSRVNSWRSAAQHAHCMDGSAASRLRASSKAPPHAWKCCSRRRMLQRASVAPRKTAPAARARGWEGGARCWMQRTNACLEVLEQGQKLRMGECSGNQGSTSGACALLRRSGGRQ